MEIVITGRNVEVPDHFRSFVNEKLDRLERYDTKLSRVEVELHHEPNRRQSKSCQRVQITCRGKGPVIRAEACKSEFIDAVESACEKVHSRLRKVHDRRRVHRGNHAPASVAEATAGGDGLLLSHSSGRLHAADESAASGSDGHGGTSGVAVMDEDQAMPDWDGASRQHGVPSQNGVPSQPQWQDREALGVPSDGPGQIVREKEHQAVPMTVDQALYEMELVGHDFFLFSCAESGRPSVVYRRRGYDYGVIRLV